jgi:ATP-dependent Clp protease ATP-binding subunit ClpA
VDAAAWLGKGRDVLVRDAGFDKSFLARWNGIYLMDELPAMHVAEVACLQMAKQWRHYGIELSYTSPDLLLEAVQRNEDFREYGVRQLAAYLQDKLTPAITQARQQGVKRVSIGIDADGSITATIT